MELLLLKTQTQEILKLIEPLAEYYRLNYREITDYEKRVIFAEHLLASELIRIASFLYANDPTESEKSLPTIAEILKEIDKSTKYDKSKLISEIDLYIKNQPQGKKNLVIEELDPPMLLRVVKFYDSVFLTNNMYIVANYLFQILNLVVKQDGIVTETEKRILTRYQSILHESNEDLYSDLPGTKKDYLNLNSVFNDFFGNVATTIRNESHKENKSSSQEAKKDKPQGNVQEAGKDEVYDLEQLMKELNDLIGLSAVKDEVTNLVNVLKVEKLRKEKNLPVPTRSLHMVFTGNPGTGKTTIGRLIAKIFKALGVLEKGHLIETDRSGLVAGFVGQTAAKTVEICNKSLGGVLFIDEAYALAEGGENDFGREAINTLLKFMEDNRGNFIVIAAGYTDNMQEFINKNPGLQSRFNKYIIFADYSPEELFSIFSSITTKSKLKLTDDATAKVKEILQTHYDKRDKKFGNGRFARNLFEKIYGNQANRLVTVTDLDEEGLCTITLEDISDL
ncbi:MAG: AAA family ATPase [Leptospiraceae bacterium]|nr:AAA family ATPase [Leptospiraceae bacterium]